MESKRTVLVCEDDPVQLRILVASFEREGYATLSAGSPSEAQALIKSSKPDILVTDVQLRQGNGFDLVDAIRKSGTDIPVVMISASATESTHERAKAAGVLHLIEKPLGVADLVRRVGGIVRVRRGRTVDGRILVVEDEPVARSLLSECLFQAGADVLVAEDGPKALQFLRSADPPVDIALTDFHLPSTSGPELIAEMRKASPGLYIAVVTGEALREEIRAGFQAGATALIRKPFSTKEVVAFVDHNLEAARRMREEARRHEAEAKAPALQRFRAWARAFVKAPKGSRMHRQRRGALIAALSLVAGVALALFIRGMHQSMDAYRKESERLLEALEKARGPDWRDVERARPPAPAEPERRRSP